MKSNPLREGKRVIPRRGLACYDHRVGRKVSSARSIFRGGEGAPLPRGLGVDPQRRIDLQPVAVAKRCIRLYGPAKHAKRPVFGGGAAGAQRIAGSGPRWQMYLPHGVVGTVRQRHLDPHVRKKMANKANAA